MDFSKTLIRCSSIGKLMTPPKNAEDKKAGNLGATAKKHLIEVYVRAVYGREKDIESRYIKKGLMVEEDSITLYSRIKKNYLKKNKIRVENSFLTGEPDLYLGESIYDAQKIVDTKSSWDMFTFFNNLAEKNTDYEWQGLGYMALTGADEFTVAYCLIDTPTILLNDEKRKLMWKMGVATDEDENYLAACEELEKSMTYDDVPLKERLIEENYVRDNQKIADIYKKVEKAREFLNELFDRLHPHESRIKEEALAKNPLNQEAAINSIILKKITK